MPEPPHQHATPGRAQHEPNVVGFRSIIMFGGGLLALTVLVLLLIGGLFRVFTEQGTATETPPSPLVATRQPPPQPLLQVTPSHDLQEMQRQQEELLSSYGWVDRASGIVRLPINRAMELLAERGLPTRPAPQETTP